MSTYTTLPQTLSKEELLTLSYDFITLNKEYTNNDIPQFLLKFWSIPNYFENENNTANEIALLIFQHILKLDSNVQEGLGKRTTFGAYRFTQLFHVFQVILATTIYSREYHLPIEAFQIFKIEKYNIPQIEVTKQLLNEYLTIFKPVGFKKKEKAPKKKYQLEVSIAAKLSNIVFVEFFIDKLISHYYLSNEFSKRISTALMAAVKHAILYVTKNDEENSIHIGIFKNLKGFNVSVICDHQNELDIIRKFNPPLPTSNNDFKGWCLYSMKSRADKVYFSGVGEEIMMLFYA